MSDNHQRFRPEKPWLQSSQEPSGCAEPHLSPDDCFLPGVCLDDLPGHCGAKKTGLDKTIHRSDRCDLSLFQLDLRLLDHFLNLGKAIPVAFILAVD